MIKDYINKIHEITKNRKFSESEIEIAKFTKDVYIQLNGGSNKEGLRRISIKFLRSIKPDMSDKELTLGITFIESMAMSVLSMFLREGTIIKLQVKE